MKQIRPKTRMRRWAVLQCRVNEVRSYQADKPQCHEAEQKILLLLFKRKLFHILKLNRNQF